MSTSITVLAAGAAAASGTSAVDTSASAVGRLDLVAIPTTQGPPRPHLDVVVEVGPTASGPWRSVFALTWDADTTPTGPTAWPSDFSTHFTVTLDAVTRVRWNANQPFSKLSLTGTGVP